ncbi:CotH kinase family protein [Actinomadura syzygii]|uniref:Spore coat protein CotH n=1 Tax=Actinomadura syzygii TaxID=1427538 RepID=A0A5D0U5B6_9ACTN|nr:CotH kinase family protein [Actinomadura syzygii]TYC13257.1 spore coat protein CotH [Actinomadura syzygii]
MSAPTRRLRHRIPVRLRHNWRLVAITLAFLGLCWGVFGSGSIHPYVTGSRADSSDPVTVDIRGNKNLFDASVPHQVKLSFRDESYKDMLNEYWKSGEKEYVEADLTVDGVTIPSVGIRLKGNSTLAGFTWKGKSRPRTGGGPGGFPGGGKPPEGMPPPGNGRPAMNGPGGFGAALKAEQPEDLPWLISFDEFVEGRRYQGRTQIAVRPAAMGSATLVNEALAIATVGAAGEPTQRYAYSSFSVNGRTSRPRLIVEYLDEGYAEELGDGVLYKSLATSTFTYKGEDQTKYTTDYKQISKLGATDLQPVIDLVKWVEKASDKEFAAGLARRVDVASFARYLALQNLMTNFDDMAGPGRNYYLWYDRASTKFKVITWDLNFAFSGDAKTDPKSTVSMGFPGGRNPTRQPQGQPPQGQPPQGPPGGPGGPGKNGGRPGGPRMGHALKDRFLKTPAFKRLYLDQYRALNQKLVANGTLSRLLDSIVRSYKANSGADTARIEAEAKTLRTTLKTRAQTLSADDQIGR